eukprot:352114-Chlamydomonas_euryale.AAC.5
MLQEQRKRLRMRIGMRLNSPAERLLGSMLGLVGLPRPSKPAVDVGCNRLARHGRVCRRVRCRARYAVDDLEFAKVETYQAPRASF